MIDIDYWHDNKTTVVTTTWWDHARKQAVSFSGVANRAPEDRFDKHTGRLLALSRSLAIAARYFERQANGRVKHADWKRQDSLQRRLKDPDGSLAKHLAAIHAPPVTDEPLPAPDGDLTVPGGHIEAMGLGDWMDMVDERAMAYEEDNARGDR